VSVEVDRPDDGRPRPTLSVEVDRPDEGRRSAVAGLLIKPAQEAMLNLFGKKTTAVMTNVPGPREKLKFLGATLEQSMFWVPQSGDIGLGVSILSYGGGVQFGVITDTVLCPDPQKIIDEFEPEFARLSLVTLMLPWGE